MFKKIAKNMIETTADDCLLRSLENKKNKKQLEVIAHKLKKISKSIESNEIL